MAINPTRLRPSDVVRLVNSTPVGPVLIDRQLRRHRDRAGFRVTDDGGQTVNIFKYAAWLSDIWFESEANPPQTYEEKKAAVRNRNIALALAGRDIGELPEVMHPELKAACRRDFRMFCETYFPETFNLAWSPDHLKVIARIETAVLEGGLFALAMPRASGKALALDTPLPTPDGWTTMEKIAVGDMLFDERGHQCRVILKSEVFTDHDCYPVTFSDGESIVCDAGHLWQVEDIFGRKNPYVRTTEWLAERCEIGNRGWSEHRFRVPIAESLQIQPTELPLSPYALGVWLGDGTCASSAVSLYDNDLEEICQSIRGGLGFDNIHVLRCKKDTHAIRANITCVPWVGKKTMSFQTRLRELGLLGNKHIPQVYLRADAGDRLELLQGIMDTDGYANLKGNCEICIKYPAFARDFGELLSSLGIKYGVREKFVKLNGKHLGPYMRFHFTAFRDQEVFRLKRKFDKLRPRPISKFHAKTNSFSHNPSEVRSIDSIVRVPTVPTQCVMVVY